VRYFTLSAPPRGNPGAPSDASTASGLLPVAAGASPKALKWGFWGADAQLCGQPGTQRIPSHPFDTKQIDTYRRGNGPGSGNAPDFFYPALYYVRGYQEHFPGALPGGNHNNMPVPATDMYGAQPLAPTAQAGGTQTSRLAQIAMRSWHVGGRKATAWPPAPQRWGTH
jgi:hypothetical protein